MSTAAPSTTYFAPRKRHYYLDNLRSFTVLVVIVFHAALAFMVYCPSWWPVIDPQQNVFFLGVVVLTDVPIMPIMFMIAGYFGIASLARKGQWTFWRDKLLRIVLPWVVGFLIIAPTSPYIWLVARHKDPSFDYFWLYMFFTKTFNTQGALWFLGVLTFFYLLLSLAYRMFQGLGKTDEQTTPPGWKFFLLFWLVPSAVFIAINQHWYDFSWVPVKFILWVQPTRVSLEAFYFALGVYAYRRQWFGARDYTPSVILWVPLAIASGAGFFWYKMHFGFLMPLLQVRIGHGLLHCFFCLTSTFALLGLFRSYLDWSTPFLARLAAGSYAIYWVHMPVTMLANLAVRGYHWNIFLKYGAVCGLSLVFSFLIGAYGLGWLPMFAGRNPQDGAPAPERPAVGETSAPVLVPAGS
jgi:peptidoglycan/LPS O-acetylase OafA/YrhL